MNFLTKLLRYLIFRTPLKKRFVLSTQPPEIFLTNNEESLVGPVAVKSLEETVNFISELWNEEITEEFFNQLDHRIRQIQENPELAPTLKNSEFRQLLIHESVSLYYRDYPEYLKLLLVWDNKQNPLHLIDKLNEANRRKK